MINAKDRAFLKGLAHNMKPLVQIGKDGISDKFLVGMDEMLSIHELVKVSVLETCMMDAKEAANEVCEKLGAEFVQAIGRRFVVYKKAEEDRKIFFPGEKKPKEEPKPSDLPRPKGAKYMNKYEAKKPKIRSVAKMKKKKKV